ncbi:MAG TPA: peptide chain release factor N(5)-glutamine methyltransferase [Intrasporangium sp.]|uniref:peptide chain release factor N(5)-glutamine methyltransferase n=1 Tax=Intrasporangium sp. TaxID=1925024 RepID=UPI002D7A1D6B|nr:peptide chain release factor N(5)-glutamine methyltransferase [Intrasporangium sp.]HET7399553.1 peptide chain release factor N(5)-glutamine methyltransferase [Intrasporangium sp.]
MTDLRRAVREATAVLVGAGIESASADAVALAAHVLRVEPAEVRRLLVLGGRAVPESYAALVHDRARRVPLQHLTGQAHFRRLTLSVGPGVFVPRPETEVLVGLALEEVDRLERGDRPRGAGGGCGARDGIRLVDLCSGSGAIPLAVKEERPAVRVRGIELSPEALAWGTRNRDVLGLDVELVQGDATRPCFHDWRGTVDVVTVNPPYIPVGAVPLDPEVRDHDPELALYGGSEDGLAIPLAVATVAAELLRPGGLVLMEHAEAQGDSLPRALAAAGPWTDVADHADLAGRPRVAAARRR